MNEIAEPPMSEIAEPKVRVLVVEDDATTSNALWVQLHIKAGLLVDQAGSLAEARALLDENPDAVLLDLGLPDGDGEDLMDEIRDRLPACRVLIVTGLPEGGRRMEAIAAKNPFYVAHKPYCMDSLLEAISHPDHPPHPPC